MDLDDQDQDQELVFRSLRVTRSRIRLERSVRVQELCEIRGGRPGLSVLTSRTVSVDVKQ